MPSGRAHDLIGSSRTALTLVSRVAIGAGLVRGSAEPSEAFFARRRFPSRIPGSEEQAVGPWVVHHRLGCARSGCVVSAGVRRLERTRDAVRSRSGTQIRPRRNAIQPTHDEILPYMGVWEGEVGPFHDQDAASRPQRFQAGARNQPNNISSLTGTFLALGSYPAASEPPGKTTPPFRGALEGSPEPGAPRSTDRDRRVRSSRASVRRPGE